MEKKRSGLKGMSEGTRDLYMINPELIQVKEGWNVRVDFGSMSELKESIRESGLKNPLRIYKEKDNIFLSDGNRRLKCIMELINEGEEIKAVPCISEPQSYSEENRIFDLILCNDGKPLDMLEMGFAFVRLMSRGYTQSEIGKKIGKTAAHVSNCVQLANAPKVTQNAITEGSISPSTVLSVVRDSETEQEVIETVQAAITKANDNGKEKATITDVQAVRNGNNRISIGKAFKSYQDFISENSIVLSEFSGYKVASAVIQFLNGELKESEFIGIIKGE